MVQPEQEEPPLLVDEGGVDLGELDDQQRQPEKRETEPVQLQVNQGEVAAKDLQQSVNEKKSFFI